MQRICRHILVLLLLTAAPQMLYADSTSQEYKLKAAFIYNFIKFIDWPDGSSDSNDRRVSVCIFGENPFADSLDQIVASGGVSGVSVSYYKKIDSGAKCHIAFVSGSEKGSIAADLAALQGRSIVTVSDIDNFVEMGGTIQLTLQEGKVRFYINEYSASRERINISSKLLTLAAKVVAEPF
ncbi:MAG: YfiR family protein [Oligoflexia bacterium]|nr:YfiR family protein [Oligoflexia bacterium]